MLQFIQELEHTKSGSYNKWVAGCVNIGMHCIDRLVLIIKYDSAPLILKRSFSWVASSEGHNYWSGICSTLKQGKVPATTMVTDHMTMHEAASKLLICTHTDGMVTKVLFSSTYQVCEVCGDEV